MPYVSNLRYVRGSSARMSRSRQLIILLATIFAGMILSILVNLTPAASTQANTTTEISKNHYLQQ